MIRKLALFVVLTALIASACGREVTPDRTGTNASGLDPGFMAVKFRVQAPFDFTNYRYVIVFNTTGNGTAPYANAANTNDLNYSYWFVVGGSGGVLAYPTLSEFYTEGQGGAPHLQQLPYSPGTQVYFNANSNGLGTEFTITFQRSLLYGIPLTPIPASTSSPGGSNPLAAPTSASQSVWYYNCFVTDPNLVPLDALGQGGVNDTSFSDPIDTTVTRDGPPYNVPVGILGPTPASSLAGSDIQNAP